MRTRNASAASARSERNASGERAKRERNASGFRQNYDLCMTLDRAIKERVMMRVFLNVGKGTNKFCSEQERSYFGGTPKKSVNYVKM